MKRTPLYEKHRKLGAKLVNFAGFEMPIQYAGIIKEHEAVRNSAGLFDVSHMGEFIISGDEAEGFLDYVMINDVVDRKSTRLNSSHKPISYAVFCLKKKNNKNKQKKQ